MKKATFLKYNKPLLTCMVQADNPDRIEELIDASIPEGAEAFGMQFCRMKREYRTEQTYKRLFEMAAPYPIYVTNYRQGYNEGKSDEELAEELITLARCGATICDFTGDLFDKREGEFTDDECAVAKQIELAHSIHAEGAEVMISSHICRFTDAEQVLRMGLEYERRGADIFKVVVGADNMEQQIENLRIIDLLKKKLRIPFLLLSSGECSLLRRIGGSLGCCMYLCVHEHDELSTKSQPLLSDMVKIRDLLGQ